MSVQFGICNFDAKPINPQELEEVRSTLAPYGPDDEGYICQGNIAVVYRAFYTTSESRREKQPHVLQSGGIITWDGRLDNRSDLIKQLGGRLSSDSTDLEIVAEAYARWETACFRRLIGDWAFSVWDPKNQTITLAKDFVGTRHLYYILKKECVAWCTILDPLVHMLQRPIQLEEKYVAGWLSFFPPADLTPYVDIRAVSPSSFVCIGGRQVSNKRYWDFDPAKRICYRSDAEYEEHFRLVLSEAVRRRLRSDSPVLAELSGGMDSSSIVCMADAIIEKENNVATRLDTVSYYTDVEPNWEERPFLERIEAQRGRIGSHIEVRPEDTFRLEFDISRPAATPTSGSCLSEASQSFARLLRANHNRTLLSGTGGDEFTGGIADPIPELANLLVELRLGSLTHQVKAWALEKRKPWLGIFGATVAKFFSSRTKSDSQLSPIPWLKLDFARRNNHAIHGYKVRWNVFGPRPSVQDHKRTLYALQRQLAADSLSSSPPFEKRYPYLDRDFLEFICAVPPEQLVRPGQRRSLMRRALAGHVPQEVLFRRRKGHIARSPMVGISSNYSSISVLCRDMRSARIGFTDETATSALLLKVRQGLEVPIIPFMRTLALEWWLRNLESFGIVEFDRANEPGPSPHFALGGRRCC